MGPQFIQPETLEERLIYWAIVGTWGFWLLGGLYVLSPVLGFGLIAIIAARALGILGEPETPRLAPAAIVWSVGMAAMLLALVVAHVDYELGAAQTIKSIFGWGKGWALLAVFIIVGSAMRIRPQIVYRATGLLAAQTLVLAPVFVLAGNIGLPAELYVSPLRAIGGPGPEFFDVTLYAIDDTSGNLRWRFFAPWSTAAAFIAGIGFVFALYERWPAWKVVGIVSAVVVCIMAGSRLSVVAMPLMLVMVIAISNARRPVMLMAIGVVAVAFVLMSEQVIVAYQDFDEAFRAARIESSRVRATLASIAYHRWITEAPIFGHGIVERGPKLVHFMAIGSHHTWHGLLFVKGAVGFVALAFPLAWSFVELSLKAQADRVARAALGVVIAVIVFSFGDNLEIVAYLVWPGLVLVGIAHGRRLRNPYAGHLGYSREKPASQRAFLEPLPEGPGGRP
jgi:hypothetical protein